MSDFHDETKRKALIAALAKNQALAEHFILESTSSRWYVAVTLLRKELSEHRPGRAFGRFLAAMSGAKSAVSDFIEDLHIAHGSEQDAVVSWAKSPKALIEEVKIIRTCLDHVGWFDTAATTSLKIKGSLEAGPIGLHIDGENHTIRTHARLGLAGLFKKFSIPIDANLDMEWVKSIEQKDSRAKLLAAMLSVESQSGEADVTCKKIQGIKQILSKPNPSKAVVDDLRESAIPAMKGYLMNVLSGMEPDIERLTAPYNDAGRHYLTVFNGIMTDIEAGNYDVALLYVQLLGDAFLPLGYALDQMLDMIAATAILLIQVKELEDQIGGPEPTPQNVVSINQPQSRRRAHRTKAHG